MARRPSRVTSTRYTKQRDRRRAPASSAWCRNETAAPPRALIGQPKPEQNRHELQRGRWSKRRELTAIGNGYGRWLSDSAPRASSVPAYIGGFGRIANSWRRGAWASVAGGIR